MSTIIYYVNWPLYSSSQGSQGSNVKVGDIYIFQTPKIMESSGPKTHSPNKNDAGYHFWSSQIPRFCCLCSKVTEFLTKQWPY